MSLIQNTLKSFLENNEFSVANNDSLLALLLGLAKTNKILLVTPNTKLNNSIVEKLKESSLKVSFTSIPAWDSSPFINSSPSLSSQGKRIASLVEAKNSQIILTPINSFLQKLNRNKMFYQELKLGMELAPEELTNILLKFSFQVESEQIIPASFKLRTNILDLFPPHLEYPVRIEFYGDTIKRISIFDKETNRSIKQVDSIKIYPVRELVLEELDKKTEFFLDISKQHRGPERIKLANLIEKNTYIPNIEFLMWTFVSLDNIIDYLKPDLLISVNDNEFYFEELEEDIVLMDNFNLSVSKLYDFSLLDSIQKKIYSNGYVHNIDDNIVLSLPLHYCSSPKEFTKQLLSQNKRVLINAKKTKLKDIHILANEEQSPLFLDEQLVSETKNNIILSIGNLRENFEFPLDRIAILSFFTKKTKKVQNASILTGQIELGDYIVHENHGIGIFKGFKTIKTQDITEDFIHIKYDGTDELFISPQQIHKIKKYKSKTASVKLDKLGAKSWQQRKKRAQEGTEKLASELLKIYAKREASSAPSLYQISPEDELKLARTFPFEETPDQISGITEILKDLENTKAMDRIICGDVGFGKTELAIRAIFRTVSNSKQVAILVPTTLLALQHKKTLEKRFKDFAINVEVLGRFLKPAEQKKIKEEVKKGTVDILVGTHAILSKSVSFKNLALLVIDEEHKFGVYHKEQLKTVNPNVHILTLTATPIPRTLNLAISGIKEISFLKTPPKNRLPIRTLIVKNNNETIKKAINQELARGGQVFYLHNRASDLEDIKHKLQKLFPNEAISIAHGKMPSKELEETVLSFYKNKIKILVCTSIIESGLDIPNANTLIVSRADLLGLSQLHQIRGRVGRSNKKAFCYLLLPSNFKLSDTSIKRMQILQKFSELGAGFQISSHDLELRGAGEFLGKNQSGFIEGVGIEEYMEMIKNAVRELRGIQKKDLHTDVKIKNLEAYLPQDYINNTRDRIEIYKRFSYLENNDEIVSLSEELQDRFGPLPKEVKRLFIVAKIRILASKIRAEDVLVNKAGITLRFTNSDKVSIDKIIKLAKIGKIQIISENKIKYPTTELSEDKILNIFSELSSSISTD